MKDDNVLGTPEKPVIEVVEDGDEFDWVYCDGKKLKFFGGTKVNRMCHGVWAYLIWMGDKLVSKEELQRYVLDTYKTKTKVDTIIAHIRKGADNAGLADPIETIKGKGLRAKEPKRKDTSLTVLEVETQWGKLKAFRQNSEDISFKVQNKNEIGWKNLQVPKRLAPMLYHFMEHAGKPVEQWHLKRAYRKELSDSSIKVYLSHLRAVFKDIGWRDDVIPQIEKGVSKLNGTHSQLTINI